MNTFVCPYYTIEMANVLGLTFDLDESGIGYPQTFKYYDSEL